MAQKGEKASREKTEESYKDGDKKNHHSDEEEEQCGIAVRDTLHQITGYDRRK